MRSIRTPLHRVKSSESLSGARDAWYVRPIHDGLSSRSFFDSRAPRTAVSPELALMYAVLQDAFLCLQQTRASAPRVRRRAHQAEIWFLSDDSRWIFSFLSICDALGLDPEYMRKKLEQWHAINRDATRGHG